MVTRYHSLSCCSAKLQMIVGLKVLCFFIWGTAMTMWLEETEEQALVFLINNRSATLTAINCHYKSCMFKFSTDRVLFKLGSSLSLLDLNNALGYISSHFLHISSCQLQASVLSSSENSRPLESIFLHICFCHPLTV